MAADNDAPNGRATIREVYDLVGEVENRLMQRLDRMEGKLCDDQAEVEARLQENIDKVDARVTRQDGVVTLVAGVAAAIAAAIGITK